MQTADWIKYGYRSTDLKYVLLAGGFSIAMAVLAVLGIRMAGKGREKQPALSAAPSAGLRHEKRTRTENLPQRAPSACRRIREEIDFSWFFCILAVQLLLSGNPNLFLSLPFPAWVSEWVLPVLLQRSSPPSGPFTGAESALRSAGTGLPFSVETGRTPYPLDAPLQVSVTKKSWNGLFLGTSREFFLPGQGAS